MRPFDDGLVVAVTDDAADPFVYDGSVQDASAEFVADVQVAPYRACGLIHAGTVAPMVLVCNMDIQSQWTRRTVRRTLADKLVILRLPSELNWIAPVASNKSSASESPDAMLCA